MLNPPESLSSVTSPRSLCRVRDPQIAGAYIEMRITEVITPRKVCTAKSIGEKPFPKKIALRDSKGRKRDERGMQTRICKGNKHTRVH